MLGWGVVPRNNSVHLLIREMLIRNPVDDSRPAEPSTLVIRLAFRLLEEDRDPLIWPHNFPGSHDMINWQGVIPEGLITLLA